MSVVLPEALAALGPVVRAGERLPAMVRVCTDTRSIAPGDTFLALRGERFDGHAFVGDAFRKGAAAAVVTDVASLPSGMPGFIVEDTTKAYMALAAAARGHLRGRVVAITGSAGKTTTTSLIAQLARHAGLGKIIATSGNENNEIGVSKLFLNMESDADLVVTEMGARHYGDIAPLAAIAQPNVAVLTNIGEAHMGIMLSRERLAETKFGIFHGDAQPILNMHDAASCERAVSLHIAPLWFGYAATPAEVRRDERTTMLLGRTRLVCGDRTWDVEVTLPGDHNLVNLAGAITAVAALGVPMETIAASVGNLTLPARRYERSRPSAFDVIFDAYNASMSGTIATLHSFSREPAERRIAVLGGMAELGDESGSMHARVGEVAAGSGLYRLLVGGAYVDDFARGALAGGLSSEAVVRFATNAQAATWLRENACAGDLVLLKGSRMYKMEEILEGLGASPLE
jgi:UDP-N-acetylmuramoyl-tripeptide--D-alanyl-D-alanine ligase